jgi:hypothetical protein
MTVRHVPQRTCSGCGLKGGKREFVRVVRTDSGSVIVDATGKKAGRGAYLCQDPTCWESSLKRGRLEHALRTRIPTETREALRAQASRMVAGVSKEEATHGQKTRWIPTP